MRLFVAVMPPFEAVDELRSAVAALPTEPGLRWTRPEQWHLTLAFLGEVDDRARENLVERLGRVARRHSSCTLALTGAGRFGNRVLWTAISGDVKPLRRLATSVRAAARRSRITMENRPYRPHLTLARAGSEADLSAYVDALRRFAGTPWTADELHLVRSDLGAGPGGTARHETVMSWPLGPAGISISRR